VRQLQDQLKKHTMIAPFDGYVAAERTEVGEWVSRGQVVAEIVYLDEVEVEAWVTESHVAAIRTQMPARIEVPALEKQVLIGEVVSIGPQADVKSRTFSVRIRVKNTITDDGPMLKSGMMARATLPVQEAVASLMAPKDAIVLGGPRPLVYVVQPAAADAPDQPPTARPCPVELGSADGSLIAVKGDLAAGQLVVTLGNERLRPGQPLKLIDKVQ
jgi:RND family efflux transporter MFP subunit